MTQTMTHSVACNICGSTDTRLLFCAVDRLHGFEGTFQYVHCRQCSLVYMNPQILSEYIGGFYPADYAPHNIAATASDIKITEPPLPRQVLNAITTQSKVLDVGCGSGGFLYQLQQARQCRVYGVDFSENAVKTAKQKYNLDLFCSRLFDAPFEDNAFDLITGRSCIEHMDNPAQVLEKIKKLCKSSGTVFLKTPNVNSLAARWFKDKWYHLDCPRHLYLFSPATIKILFEKCGFQDIRIAYETSSKGWLGSLQYVFYGDNYRSEIKNKIRRSALARVIVSPLAHLSALLRQADTMTVTARKA